jgi:hypothetical protein
MPLGKIEIARWMVLQEPFDEPAVRITVDMSGRKGSLDTYIGELDEAYASATHAIRREHDRREALRQRVIDAQLAAANEQTRLENEGQQQATP